MADPHDTRLIDISTPSHPDAVCVVDANDYPFLSQWKWRMSDTGYAIRDVTIHGVTYKRSMHRIVADVPDGVLIDHVNGNRLDNRRANLRYVDHRQNSLNRRTITGRKYKGAYKNNTGSSWHAKIRVHGKVLYLGCYPSEDAAARAYDAAALRHFGEYAKVNFPDEVVGAEGLEPSAKGLKGPCSTN